MGTVFVLCILALAVFGIVSSMVKDKKKGISACGGNCASCKGCHH